MVFNWKKFTSSLILLPLAVMMLELAACKKNMSSDTPLPPSYYPSVIMGSDNSVLYGINPSNGTRNWEYALPSDVTMINAAYGYFRPSALVYNGMIYQAVVNSDTIYKINSRTGALVKKLTVSGYNAVPAPAHHFRVMGTPIADNGLIYLPSTNDTLYVIDTGTGTVRWKYGCGSAILTSPVIFNGKVYVNTYAGHFICLDKTVGPDISGLPIWDWPGIGVSSTARFISSPSVSKPYIYAGGATDSNMYCVYLDSQTAPNVGTLRWTYKSNGNINSSPTAYGGVCIFGCNDFYVYALDTQTALPKWKFRTNSQINSSPIISNQVVYIGSYDYNLYAINIINGTQKWKFGTKGLIKASPVPYKGHVYVGSYDGYLYAVDSAFGVMKWSYKINGNIQSSPAVEDFSNIQYNSGISGFNTSGNNN